MPKKVGQGPFILPVTRHPGRSPLKMTSSSQIPSLVNPDPSLSLYHLLEPDVLANPYPLYHRLRTEDPVHWDSYLHSWVVTRYKDVVTVLQNFSAARTPTPHQLTHLALSDLEPVPKLII